MVFALKRVMYEKRLVKTIKRNFRKRCNIIKDSEHKRVNGKKSSTFLNRLSELSIDSTLGTARWSPGERHPDDFTEL